MTSIAGFLQTIILLGAIQGFIISILLFLSKKGKSFNRILATLIFLITLASFNLYASYKNWFNIPQLEFASNFLPMVIIMPVGPLIYFYVQSLLNPGFTISKKLWWHFIPVIIDIVPPLTAIFFVTGVLTGILKNHPAVWGNFIDTYNVYSDIPRWISVTFYIWLSAKYLSDYQKQHSQTENHQHVQWLRQFTRIFMIFQGIWLLYLIPYVIPRFTNYMLDTFDWYPVYIPLAVMIYWLGIKGYTVAQQNTTAIKKPATRLAVSAAITRQTQTALAKAMEVDKLYLNHNLNLQTLSQHTGITQKVLSSVLNQHMHKSFNDFINEYRVAEFKAKIHRPEMNHLTIAGVALECGFNSQATFQRTFKELTGQSPSAFRKLTLQTA